MNKDIIKRAFWNSESVKPIASQNWFTVLNWIANHFIQNWTSKCVSQIIWFRTGLQSTFRKSFNWERDFKARIVNHFIQNGTSKHVKQIIWFRTGLESAFRESFDSERDFIVRFTNHFIRTGDKNNSAEAVMHRPGGESTTPPPPPPQIAPCLGPSCTVGVSMIYVLWHLYF